jgi:hypothetical protein
LLPIFIRRSFVSPVVIKSGIAYCIRIASWPSFNPLQLPNRLVELIPTLSTEFLGSGFGTTFGTEFWFDCAFDGLSALWAELCGADISTATAAERLSLTKI